MEDVGYGDGNVIRRSDGRLQVTVWFEGKRIYRLVPKRLVERDPKAAAKLAEKYRRELVERRDAGLSGSSQTLEAFLRSWIESLRDAKRSRVRPRTLDHYRLVVEQHIIPALGKRPLDRLSERHIQAWLDADDAAPRTVSHHRAVLRRALNTAVRQRLIARNPALAVELPTVPDYRAATLTLDEARKLLDATKDDRLGPLWRLALDTGAREGELLGLGWDDVDIDAGTVTIAAQLQRRDGAWVRVPTKAARALGTLSLMPSTVAALERHRRRMVEERTPDWRYHGLVFVTEKGEPYHPARLLDEFHAACRRAGIAERRVHDLRASSATLAREQGVPEDVRMARLGHSTTAMARHYGQARTGLDRDAAALMERALSG